MTRPKKKSGPKTPSSATASTRPSRPLQVEVAKRLLREYQEFDNDSSRPIIEKAQQTIRDTLSRMGMTIVSYEITDEPLLDPRIEALAKADRDQVDAVARNEFPGPAQLLEAAEALIDRFPNIPVLWNQKFRAIMELKQDEQADEVSAEMVRRFPNYVFGFCNRVMFLLHPLQDRIEEARALMETGPRGPLLILTEFDRSRSLFHVSEVAAFTYLVGTYLIATDRLDAARIQLDMLKDAAPDSPQVESLTRRIEQAESPSPASILLKVLTREKRALESRRKPKTTKPTSKR